MTGVNSGQGGGQIQRQGQQDQSGIDAPQGEQDGQQQGSQDGEEELFAVLTGFLIPVQSVDLLDVCQAAGSGEEEQVGDIGHRIRR